VYQPARDLLGFERGISFPDRLDERLPPFELRAQRTNAPLEAGGEIDSTSTAPSGIRKVRLGGDRCHR
jgi:hypothetical protein